MGGLIATQTYSWQRQKQRE